MNRPDENVPDVPIVIDVPMPPECRSPRTMCGDACVDTDTNTAHCGGCGNGCSISESCVGGRCSCDPETGLCNPLGDPDSCGSPPVRCDNEQLCAAGECMCRPGLIDFGSGCTDPFDDPSNCGGMGPCLDGLVCFGGGCHGRCPTNTEPCGGRCVSFASDPLNCGGCGQGCNQDEVCVQGSCRGYSAPASCTSCPCEDCAGRGACCVYGVGHICVEADTCPNTWTASP